MFAKGVWKLYFLKIWILPLWKSYSYDKHTNNKTVFIQQSNQHLEGFTFSIIKRFKLHWKVHFERQINYQWTLKCAPENTLKDAHNFEELCSTKGQGFYRTNSIPPITWHSPSLRPPPGWSWWGAPWWSTLGPCMDTWWSQVAIFHSERRRTY